MSEAARPASWKKIAILCSLGLIFVMLTSILVLLRDRSMIGWDTTTKDDGVSYTRPATLELGAVAYDGDGRPIYDIAYSVDGGEIEPYGAKVRWALPDTTGDYTISAATPSGKVARKTVRVISANEDATIPIHGVLTPEEETDDSDHDGLSNESELENGTNPQSADTDSDGIGDYHEITETKTDPLKADSDGDGVNDGDEMDLGLDPSKSDSKNDGVSDGERRLSYIIDDARAGVSLALEGKGNLASSTVDKIENPTLETLEGVLGQMFFFHSAASVERALAKIKYSPDEMHKKGLAENDLTLYRFDEATKEFDPVETTVDTDNHVLAATLDGLAKYVIGDKKIVSATRDDKVMFVIDNSMSMYSDLQMKKAGYDSSTGTLGNDTGFKRLTLSKKLIEMLSDAYKYGVAEFSGDYVNLIHFTNEAPAAQQAVESMRSNWHSNASGTNIVSALLGGIEEFSIPKNGDRHYLILLTDGKDTTDTLSYYEKPIIDDAKSKEVRVCVIGLGSEIDTDSLNNIATQTGCGFYNANDASALDEIYAAIGADINYNYVDTDDDSKPDGVISADSGFLTNRDGFSFQNFASNKSEGGHCYGMATFAMAYFTHRLPTKLPWRDKSSRSFFVKFDDAAGYDLTGTYFDGGSRKLYDFKIQNEALSLLLKRDKYSTLRDRIEDGTWMIRKEYYDKLASIGAIFSINKYRGKDKDFSKYQSAIIDFDSDLFKSAVSRDEQQVLSAIWRLFVLQADDKRTSFLTSPDKAYDELIRNLRNGTPIVLAVAYTHAVNAIKLVQNTDDANSFKIEIYDNNFPGETRYINVRRSKFSKFQLNFTAWTNEYNYTFTYDKNNDGVLDDVSLELSFPEIK